jgi:hypothetical protein
MGSSYQLKRTWDPTLVVRAHFGQDTMWVSSKGEYKEIAGMPVPYALNCLLYLERVREFIEPHLEMDLQQTALYKALRTRALMGEGATYVDKDGNTRSAPAERAARLQAVQA